MTQITGSLSKKRIVIEIIGHAGVTDICNAESTLTYTLAENLRREAGRRFDFMTADGRALLKVEKPSQQERLITEAFLLGFEMLAYNFTENVVMDIREE